MKLMTYLGEEQESKLALITSVDGTLSDLMEKIRGFVMAAGFSPESVKEYMPDNE